MAKKKNPNARWCHPCFLEVNTRLEGEVRICCLCEKPIQEGVNKPAYSWNQPFFRSKEEELEDTRRYKDQQAANASRQGYRNRRGG